MAGAGAGAGLLVWWLMRRMRVPAPERERRRRLAVNAYGRMVDGHITDANQDFIFYTYTARGVTYTTSQEISTLRDVLPADPAALIGPVTVKFSTRNPADSIVVCEGWSGFRQSAGGTARTRP